MITEIINAKQKYHSSSGKFSISSIGSCMRTKYMEIKGLYKKEFDTKTLRTFSIGNLIHLQVTNELLQKSEQFNWRVIGAEIDIPEHPKISGRCDIVLCNSKTKEMLLIDVKSCSPWTFKNVDSNEFPFIENYKNQLQLYLHFFNIPKGVLLFVNKSSSEVKEVEVIYDKDLCLKLIKEIEDFFINYVDKNIEPPKCDLSISPFGCECCGVEKK